MSGLQEMASKLRTHWRRQGCVELPPLDLEVAEPLTAPSCFFRLHGQPFSAVQTLLVRSGSASRRGESMLRLSKQMVCHVLLKGAEEGEGDLERLIREPTKTVLESLRAMGLEYLHHEVRFRAVELEVNSHDLEGVGWAVSVSGLPVVRMLYVSRCAGETVDPPCLSLSYKMETLAMVLQGVGLVEQLRWSGKAVSYDDIRFGEERELVAASRAIRQERVLSVADSHLEEAEQRLGLELGQVAYESVMRAQAVMGALDSTEVPEMASRQAKVKGLVRGCSELVQVQRSRLADTDEPQAVKDQVARLDGGGAKDE